MSIPKPVGQLVFAAIALFLLTHTKITYFGLLSIMADVSLPYKLNATYYNIICLLQTVFPI